MIDQHSINDLLKKLTEVKDQADAFLKGTGDSLKQIDQLKSTADSITRRKIEEAQKRLKQVASSQSPNVQKQVKEVEQIFGIKIK